MGQTALSKDGKIISVLDFLQTAANTNRTSEVIDTKGFNSLLLIMKAGSMATNADSTVTVQSSDVADDQNTLNTGSDVTDTSQAYADDEDNEVRYWDFVSLDDTKRYMQVTVTKDTANASDEAIVGVLYNATSQRPTTHGSGNSTVGEGTKAVTGETYTSAAQGTA